MTDDFSARPPRILTTEQRQARDAQREAEAKEAMRDHEMAQKASHEKRKRLKALRLARKAAASK
jgi:DNA-binding TFAR19-related protein (PDSD5 family)